MTKTLEEKVEQWFIDRNLHEVNPVKQFEKLMEESGELFEGIAKGKTELIYDALGDMQVVLIGLEQQINNGAQIEASPQEMELLLMVHSLGELAQKLYKHVFHDETQLPFIRPELLSLQGQIHALAIHNGTSADDCLQIAYDEIKNRKGKMVDGVFVKHEDLANDYINKPSHYQGKDSLEAIEVVKQFIGSLDGAKGFYWGNMMKYVLRFQKKNGLEDLKKARKNLDWLIEDLEDEK